MRAAEARAEGDENADGDDRQNDRVLGHRLAVFPMRAAPAASCTARAFLFSLSRWTPITHINGSETRILNPPIEGKPEPPFGAREWYQGRNERGYGESVVLA